MIPELRHQFNANFSQQRYEEMVNWIRSQYDYLPPFRICETPVFIPNDFKRQLLEACESIADVLAAPDFRERSQSAVEAGQEVPNETPNSIFLQMDFGVCTRPDGSLTPQLIEVQGFPSLYGFQHLVARAYRRFFDIPDNFAHLFGGLSSKDYIELLRKLIVADHDPENVILLEIEPIKQTTAIDFIVTQHLLGVNYVCISELKKEGKNLYYFKDGRKIPVKRIYNRVIFDELIRRDDLKREYYFADEVDVEWAGHPNWFFRISKHTLPLFDNPYVPKSHYLSDLTEIPEDLHNYVLKPLYSFAGTGVIINLNRADIESIPDPQHYILQRKVEYAPVIPTPTGPAKVEIRMLMLWEHGTPRPRIVNNLCRLSKGEMVGVRYNKGKEWVGGSVGFFDTNG